MGQVPQLYGILGDGRVARHFSHYFALENLNHVNWSRKTATVSLVEAFQNVDVVLLLVSDKAIESVIDENPFLLNKRLIHFSGSHLSQRAAGFHPLMSFADNLYSLETYRRLPFIVEQESSFNEIFPTLKNHSFPIKREDKPLYHALCVLGGNVSAILWNKVMTEFGQRFDIPREAIFPFLDQVTTNLKNLSERAVTGPLTRGDHQTIENNLQALKSDPYEKVYRAVADIYLKGSL